MKIFVLLAVLLCGCATVSKGSRQDIALQLQTSDGTAVSGVPCEVSNKLGRWNVTPPDKVNVERSSGPLSIRCENEAWQMAEQQTVQSEGHVGKSVVNGAKTGAGVGAVAGYASPLVLFGAPLVGLSVLIGALAGTAYGGLTGGVVDASSGAAFDYAPSITVIVQPRPAPQFVSSQ